MPSRPVALVTGAARRIGRAIALDLATHGHDVALHCHRPSDDSARTLAELRALGARAELFAADLADEAACRALMPAVAEAFGRVDALVNNASRFAYDDAASFGHAEMEAHWRVNAAAPILLTRALHDQLCRREADGCVVNLLDQKLDNPNPDYLSYTLSKAALHSATVMLAQALAPRLRVCGVSPGVTLLSGEMSEADFASAHRLTPLRRSSTPQDIAHAVRYLIEASAVTGTTLLVDGGQHLVAQPRDVAFLVKTP
ncbi:SDR family oxidoreductase [uncultured Piscinibacter sp.]|uniref:SDR family oxidoreductase n=1 Tax=uncultured Piscinibacter sp. TaxID=1131835 RepID=UPI002603E4E9|nr:SDR family oxidoreductase [uncultured Piscinibacter sp.]